MPRWERSEFSAAASTRRTTGIFSQPRSWRGGWSWIKFVSSPRRRRPTSSCRPDHPTAPARLHLLQLATAGHPKLEACDLELRRGGVSYTADTVRQLRKQHPADRLYLLVGPDMFLTLERLARAGHDHLQCHHRPCPA